MACTFFQYTKISRLSFFAMPMVLGVAFGLGGCDKKSDKMADKSSTLSPSSSIASVATPANNELQLLKTDVIDAKAERFQPSVPVTGTLQVANRTEVQSTVNAQVVSVLADVGKRVKQGERLVALDNRSSKDQLAQAQADVVATTAQARVALSLAQKNKVLLDQGFVSQIEYERSMADAIAQQEALKARQAQLNAAQRLSGDTVITAPNAGVISKRTVEVGQVVSPNQPLMEIIDPSQLEFAANIPAEAQNQIMVGQHVPFTIANRSTQFVGQVSRISPQVDPATRQLTVYIAVNTDQAQGLRAGIYATGRVEYGQTQVGVLVPMSAVTVTTTAPASAPSSGLNDKINTANHAIASGTVWTIGKDQIIRQQVVNVIRRDDAHSQYLVEGIEQGTLVITANLSQNDKGKKAVLK